MPATNQWAVSTLIREVLADPDLARRASSAACSGPGRTGPVGVWIAPGVVEGLNPWKDEDHARTQEVPR